MTAANWQPALSRSGLQDPEDRARRTDSDSGSAAASGSDLATASAVASSWPTSSKLIGTVPTVAQSAAAIAK